MSAKKPKKNKPVDEVSEPAASYATGKVVFFNSFLEQEEYELKQMALLSSIQVLEQLRKFINIAYGMHGYDPNKLPQKHSVRIIDSPDEHF